MGDAKFSFFTTDILLLIVFLGLTKIIFQYSGLGFALEFLFTLFLLFIAFIALIPAYSGSKTGWSMLSFVFIFVILNLLFIYLRTGETSVTYLGTLLASSFGFVIATLNIRSEEPQFDEDEVVYTNFEPPPKPKKVAKKTPKKRTKKK